MTDDKPFGVGFIGCGSYNTGLAQSAANSPLLNPVACCDVVKERADAIAEKHDMAAYVSIDTMLARDDIDGVIIASPNSAHRGNVEAAVKAGKHVFVDKPIANSIEDALAIIDLAKKANLTLAVGHNGRRMGGHRKLKELLDAGAVGTAVTVEANFSHAGGMGLTEDQWRFHRDECPALPLMQLGVHFADTVQYLLGDVTEVSSFMSHRAVPADNYDSTVTLLRFTDGLVGYLGSNYATPAVYYVNIYGTEGNLYCIWGGEVRYMGRKSRDMEAIPVGQVDTQIEELEEFARCARSGETPEVDGPAALKALAIVRGALKSQETGMPVKLDELIAEAGR